MTNLDGRMIGCHKDLMQCVVHENEDGTFDVALVVDGHYVNRDDAEEMCAFWLARAREELL